MYEVESMFGEKLDNLGHLDKTMYRDDERARSDMCTWSIFFKVGVALLFRFVKRHPMRADSLSSRSLRTYRTSQEPAVYVGIFLIQGIQNKAKVPADFPRATQSRREILQLPYEYLLRTSSVGSKLQSTTIDHHQPLKG
jgi:hypothetical protein